MASARGEGSTLEDDHPMFSTDEFRMYCMKILPCAKRFVHDWVHCPFSHPGEKAKRRDPRYMVYTGIACPSMKKAGACPRGERCPYAHNVFEYWLHPTRYRTQLCNDGMECRRRVCFFAHSLAELRVPATKPFVPPEMLAALEGQPTTSQEAAAVSEALRRISSSWQAGGQRGNSQAPEVAAAHGMEAAQIESRVLEHLYGNAPAEVAVQQLRAASADALIGDACLQARLTGALAALRRSRSSDDSQGVLIELLQGMLSEAMAYSSQQQPEGRQGEASILGHQGSDSFHAEQPRPLTPAEQAAELHAFLQEQQAGMESTISRISGGSLAQFRQQPNPQAQQPWQRTHLPQLRENHVLQNAAALVGMPPSSGPIMRVPDSNVPGSSASSSASEAGQPLDPAAAEAYTSWLTAHHYVDNGTGRSPEPHRRSLQQDLRPAPAQGQYPRRRSLQVEDWHTAAANPFARTSGTRFPDVGRAPVPLQEFASGRAPSAYINMFEGAYAAGSGGAGSHSAFGQQQRQHQLARGGSSGEMHFPSRWPVQNTVPRNSLDSHQPHQDPMFPRQSLDMLRPTSEAYAARLSLDVNSLHGSDFAAGLHRGSTSRNSNAFSDTDLPGSRSRGSTPLLGVADAVRHKTSPTPNAANDLGWQFSQLSVQQPAGLAADQPHH